MTVLRHTWFMTVRQARNLMREPIWIVMMIIQPLIWLLLYGQLFSRVGSLRGSAGSYVEFLTPGIVCMTTQGSRALGTVFINSCVNVNATFVSPVSMIGASPVTVTVSLTAAGAS